MLYDHNFDCAQLFWDHARCNIIRKYKGVHIDCKAYGYSGTMPAHLSSMGATESTWLVLESTCICVSWHRSGHLFLDYRSNLHLVSSYYRVEAPNAAAEEVDCHGHLQPEYFRLCHHDVQDSRPASEAEIRTSRLYARGRAAPPMDHGRGQRRHHRGIHTDLGSVSSD